MTPAELERNLGLYCDKANKAERAAVEAQEQFEILEDAKKMFFAEVVEEQSGKTTAEKERQALVSHQWKEWMAGYQAARQIALQARVEKNVQVRNWETCRSLLSSKRIERTTGI